MKRISKPAGHLAIVAVFVLLLCQPALAQSVSLDLGQGGAQGCSTL